MYLKQIIIVIFIISLYTSLQAAADKDTIQPEKILVRIGDKTISVDEFIRRAEYTVRPKYCRENTPIHKKIILNSLIAEKLLALESGDQNDFILNPRVQAYLLGRKEQAMRLLLYDREVISKTVIDSNLVRKVYNQAGRTYKIKYVSVKNSYTAQQIQSEIHTMNIPFERILKENYSLREVPVREVSFSQSEHPKIIDSLFSNEIVKDQVIGPIQIETGETIFIQVTGWTDKPAITQDASKQRMQLVSDLYSSREHKKRYEEYIRKIMKGKNIVFEPNTFLKFVEIAAPLYIRTGEQEKKIIQQGYSGSNEVEVNVNTIKPELTSLLKETIFKIKDEEWTVQKLLDEITLHPLVFRKRKIENREFGQELQFAIIDLVRDKYLTEEARKAGYGNSAFVIREYSGWKDNLNFISERTNYLKSIGKYDEFETNYPGVIEKHLNRYIDTLQKKYSSIIDIDIAILENIKLTRLDMAVTYSGSPFAQVVPNFPIITNDYHLDYGGKMDVNN